ncbi:tRNA (N(6)-L-threonylcarbamoyladenosine(37)-C(2))-methylthiotransferase MtaB [Aquirufa nivalisilvae]|uniref:tRNA (N(6)-L-threonylcarbamoyladenosine(37)-C(2))- methylthiotransferase MtaB n=1 Tax=Aquirufa nivalisilvae TaxID=2516557 RepID=UPI0022A96435|nr:tRNA (N(6)-L-threonylcarbamoyladenosine(37)-C(2))-methylthiotransferase MtaB [Aquirufa nivalisilvae]MCZ2480137.1 tRNA (N(6)-L-threonylcarbamoyladenosine(37)-C(2))-methylthiotransferase MtaB [Aquirufa nivalisilvae]MCZ2482468.1 tRNA (N(6)-L-threonylcarbamoyladenosine(37)-C(2))-methylthiotransferase MtaB [Aquirufa nivalisilvae]
MKKLAFYTLGCKLNFAESSTIARSLEPMGFERVEFQQSPDLFVINTCSVTDQADKKCKKVVKEAKKINPESIVVILGCYAQLKPDEIVQIPGVDLVLGANEKFQLADIISPYFVSDTKKYLPKVIASEIRYDLDYHASYSVNDRTRTFLKVQDGCDYPCSYCTIPLARGQSRSSTIENVLGLVKEIAEKGVKEVVLTGVNIGDFGIQQGKRVESFFDLVKSLDAQSDLNRFRISSIEPNLLHSELLQYLAESQHFVPHFHVPLQSGSNAVLRLMKRRYQRELYAERVREIKSLMPHACIGVDVIVGHPGETEEMFLDTYHFLNDLDISYLHVFTYSERANTYAVDIQPKIDAKVKAERSKMLHILSDKKRRAFYETQLGRKGNVLFEEASSDGFMEGFSENYVRVRVPYDPLLINTIQPVRYKSLDEEGLMRADILLEQFV